MKITDATSYELAARSGQGRAREREREREREPRWVRFDQHRYDDSYDHIKIMGVYYLAVERLAADRFLMRVIKQQVGVGVGRGARGRLEPSLPLQYSLLSDVVLERLVVYEDD